MTYSFENTLGKTLGLDREHISKLFSITFTFSKYSSLYHYRMDPDDRRSPSTPTSENQPPNAPPIPVFTTPSVLSLVTSQSVKSHILDPRVNRPKSADPDSSRRAGGAPNPAQSSTATSAGWNAAALSSNTPKRYQSL